VVDVNAIFMFACVDYTGISLLITASIMTVECTAFFCEPLSQWLYMGLSAFLAGGGVVLPWQPRFNGADMAWSHVVFHVGLALTGFMPILQLYMTRRPKFVYDFYSAISESILVYLGGAMVYTSKIPERR
jgi:adiponectin receptor